MRYDVVGLLVACLSISSCERPAGVAPRERGDWHIVKCGLTWDATIADPRCWALEQFADGPIEGPVVDEWGRIVVGDGLVEERRDLDGDGVCELFIRADVPQRFWTFLVFSPVEGGWRYLGYFDAGPFRVLPRDEDGRPRLVAYEACGGHYGFINTYVHDGAGFVCVAREVLAGGDGAPEENNRRLAELFGW